MKKSISTLILIITLTLGISSIANAETVWLSGPFDDGGFGDCHWNQNTGVDIDGNVSIDEVTVQTLHGHWSGVQCVLGRVSIEVDSTNYTNAIFTSFWNIVLNAIQTGKAVIN